MEFDGEPPVKLVSFARILEILNSSASEPNYILEDSKVTFLSVAVG